MCATPTQVLHSASDGPPAEDGGLSDLAGSLADAVLSLGGHPLDGLGPVDGLATFGAAQQVMRPQG